jgi:twitching motility protein PilT
MHIDELLRQAADARASDLHLAVGIPPMIRVSGVLQPIGDAPVSAEQVAHLAYGMFSPYHKKRFDDVWDVDFSYAVAGAGRFRVNVHKQRGSIGIVARIIPDRIPSIEDLRLPAILRELTDRPRGLILVTGPTSQGKSTTLAAMVDFINHHRNTHIVTIEDPIEYVFPHRKSIVIQREVGSDTQSFPNALRAVLREDPNVVVVGEMRDLETIATTLTIAETGHLVFGTLHTANAAQTIDRIIDVFPPEQQQQIRVQLGGVLEAVISQQLLPLLGPAEPPSGDTGLAGRVPAVEIMVCTPALRNIIREGKNHQIHAAIQTGAQHGMQTMDQALSHLYRAGVITLDNAMARAIYPDDLRRSLEHTSEAPQNPVSRRRA